MLPSARLSMTRRYISQMVPFTANSHKFSLPRVSFLFQSKTFRVSLSEWRTLISPRPVSLAPIHRSGNVTLSSKKGRLCALKPVNWATHTPFISTLKRTYYSISRQAFETRVLERTNYRNKISWGQPPEWKRPIAQPSLQSKVSPTIAMSWRWVINIGLPCRGATRRTKVAVLVPE